MPNTYDDVDQRKETGLTHMIIATEQKEYTKHMG
jgi:hypothetical protein